MNNQMVICSHCCTSFNPDTLLVTQTDRVFCSHACCHEAFERKPAEPRSTKMSEKAKARLREVQQRKRMLLMKHIDPVALLASCDAWDECDKSTLKTWRPWDFHQPSRVTRAATPFGLSRWIPERRMKRWRMRGEDDYSNYNWCWLTYTPEPIIQALAGRLPHRRITTVGFNRSTRERVITNRIVFDFQTIVFVLKHYGDVNLTKYVVACSERFVTSREVK